MFGLGMGELLVIFVVALLVLGPKRLPDVATGLGKAIRDFRRATRARPRPAGPQGVMAASKPAEPRDEEAAVQGDDRRMPFMAHLSELRDRLRTSVIAVLAATMIAYLFRGPLFALMARPLIVAWLET